MAIYTAPATVRAARGGTARRAGTAIAPGAAGPESGSAAALHRGISLGYGIGVTITRPRRQPLKPVGLSSA
jgi:hypothetical protein